MGAKIEAARGKSPYSKRGKTPFRYSEAYERWARAVGLAGIGALSPDAIDADVAFRRTFGVPQFAGPRNA